RSYRLDLPKSMKIHPVFHVSLLEPAATDPLDGQRAPTSLPIVIDGENEWEVEEILNSRYYRGDFQYLIKWVEFTDPSWQPYSYITHCDELLEDFFARYPSKPRPPRPI